MLCHLLRTQVPSCVEVNKRPGAAILNQFTCELTRVTTDHSEYPCVCYFLCVLCLCVLFQCVLFVFVCDCAMLLSPTGVVWTYVYDG